MAKRKRKQVNNMTIIEDTATGLFSVVDRGGKQLVRNIVSMKLAEEFCRDSKKVEEAQSTTDWREEPIMQSANYVGTVGEAMGRATGHANIALPKPGSYAKDIKGVIALFEDRLGKADENARMRLEQAFNEFQNKGQPAFERLQEAICIVSTKTRAEQRTIAYLLGIIKQWNEYGYGNNFTDEQKKVLLIFEKKIGMPLSLEARGVLIKMFATYGIVDVMATLFQKELQAPDVDLSLMYAQQLESLIADSAESALQA